MSCLQALHQSSTGRLQTSTRSQGSWLPLRYKSTHLRESSPQLDPDSLGLPARGEHVLSRLPHAHENDVFTALSCGVLSNLRISELPALAGRPGMLWMLAVQDGRHRGGADLHDTWRSFLKPEWPGRAVRSRAFPTPTLCAE